VVLLLLLLLLLLVHGGHMLLHHLLLHVRVHVVGPRRSPGRKRQTVVGRIDRHGSVHSSSSSPTSS